MGRKRNIVTDTIGVLLVVLVTAASLQDNAASRQLLTQVATEHPAIRKAWADMGYKTAVVEHGADRHRDRPPRPHDQGIRRPAPPLDRRANLQLAHEPPPPRPRLRSPTRPLRSHDPRRDDQPHDPTAHRRNRPDLARNLNPRLRDETPGHWAFRP
ncbi:hypothetical protein GCM10010440_74650 [Kitasatospora cinereorecta]